MSANTTTYQDNFHAEYRVEFRHKAAAGRWQSLHGLDRTYRDRADAEKDAAERRAADFAGWLEYRVVSRHVTDWEPVGES